MVFDDEYQLKRGSFNLRSTASLNSNYKKTYDLSIFENPRVQITGEAAPSADPNGGIHLEVSKPTKVPIKIDQDQDFTVDKQFYLDQYKQNSPDQHRVPDDPLSHSMREGTESFEKQPEFDMAQKEEDLSQMRQEKAKEAMDASESQNIADSSVPPEGEGDEEKVATPV